MVIELKIYVDVDYHFIIEHFYSPKGTAFFRRELRAFLTQNIAQVKSSETPITIQVINEFVVTGLLVRKPGTSLNTIFERYNLKHPSK